MTRREFLYEMSFAEILLTVRGYQRRHRDMWSAVRWQTFNLMCVSMADLKKAGIYAPTDLIKFPWEDDTDTGPSGLPTAEEIAEMRRKMREENERHEAEQQQQQQEKTEST